MIECKDNCLLLQRLYQHEDSILTLGNNINVKIYVTQERQSSLPKVLNSCTIFYLT